jgi:hypothetical protein
MGKAVAAISLSGPAFRVTKKIYSRNLEKGGSGDGFKNFTKIRFPGREGQLRIGN